MVQTGIRKDIEWTKLAADWVWRHRPAVLGVVGLVLAAFAQKLLTDDRALEAGFRLYVVAAAVTILGWWGTRQPREFWVDTPSSMPLPRASRVDALAGGMVESRWRRPAASIVNWLREWRAILFGRPIAEIERELLATAPTGVPPAKPAHAQLTRVLATAHFSLGPAIAHELGSVGFLTIAGIVLGLAAIHLLRVSAYGSLLGGALWPVSMAVLLLAAVLADRRRTAASVIQQHSSIPRKLEIALVGLLFLVTAFMHFYRLDDWSMGVIRDEGVFGTYARQLLEEGPVTPFRIGLVGNLFFQFWPVAAAMKLLGTDLFALRFLYALLGTLMLLPFYGLVRVWFGPTTALIAAAVLATSNVAMHGSRVAQSVIVPQLAIVLALWLASRGFQSRNYADFVLAGFSASSAVYFYFGGQLTPPLLLLIFGYVLVVLPLWHHWHIERPTTRDGGRVPTIFGAITGVRDSHHRLVEFRPHLLLLTLAALLMAGPWITLYIDRYGEMGGRGREKLIFNMPDRMASHYSETHAPLSVFGVPILEDGFWPRILWHQTTRTLSMFTHRAEMSGFFAWPDTIIKPLETVLAILGLAWCGVNLKDARLATLFIWISVTVVVGGTLTDDQPYMVRLFGMLPAMVMVIALVLHKIATELMHATETAGTRPQRYGRIGGVALVVAVLTILSAKNVSDYLIRYPSLWAHRGPNGFVLAVRHVNDQFAAQGRDRPFFYSVRPKGDAINWHDNPLNAWFNYGTQGTDLWDNTALLAREAAEETRDVVFLISDPSRVDMVKLHFPHGIEEPFHWGEPTPSSPGDPLFTIYVVRRT